MFYAAHNALNDTMRPTEKKKEFVVKPLHHMTPCSPFVDNVKKKKISQPSAFTCRASTDAAEKGSMMTMSNREKKMQSVE